MYYYNSVSNLLHTKRKYNYVQKIKRKVEIREIVFSEINDLN